MPAAKPDDGALAIVNQFTDIVSVDELKTLIQEEMTGMKMQFDRIKIPSGGGQFFEVPSDDPENPDMVREIVGIIVDQHPINGYWREKFSGGNTPPDCASMDGLYGEGMPGGECLRCPLNQWGSAIDDKGQAGAGKACKNMRRVFLRRPGELFPVMITLPPTSLGNLQLYLSRLIKQVKSSHSVITRITLKKAKSSGGIEYSEAVCAKVSDLPDELKKKMEAYSKGIKAFTRRVEVAEDEYQPGAATAYNRDTPEAVGFNGPPDTSSEPF